MSTYRRKRDLMKPDRSAHGLEILFSPNARFYLHLNLRSVLSPYRNGNHAGLTKEHSMTVVSLPTARTRKAFSPVTKTGQRTQSRALKRRLRRQAFAAVTIGLVATVLTALSLSHLAHGIEIVTRSGGWQAWAFAIGIDVAMIAAELAMLFAAAPNVRKQVSTYGKPFLVGTLAASAVMNALAFSENQNGLMLLPAIAFGVAIPMMIYALTRIGAALYVSGDRA